jgi:hypothetical protein
MVEHVLAFLHGALASAGSSINLLVETPLAAAENVARLYGHGDKRFLACPRFSDG